MQRWKVAFSTLDELAYSANLSGQLIFGNFWRTTLGEPIHYVHSICTVMFVLLLDETNSSREVSSLASIIKKLTLDIF